MKKILIIVCIAFITTSVIQAQDIKIRSVDDQNQPKMIVGIKDSLNPDVYIDGVKYNHKILSLIDSDRIESMRVVTDEKELKEYNAEHGLILVTTKKIDADKKIRVRAFGSMNQNPTPLVLIDGNVVSQEELSKLLPSDIESVNIWKGESAKELYNAPNGAIIIKTKKMETTTEDKIKNTNGLRKAVVILDGKVTDQEELAKIPQSEIESIKYLRGEEADAVYKGAGVVVVVKTKK